MYEEGRRQQRHYEEEKAAMNNGADSFDDVRSFITNQMGSLIRLNGSEGSLMFKNKIENLSPDVR